MALIVVTLGVAYGPGLAGHLANSAQALNYNDDARQQIWPLLRYGDPSLFRDDYLADYQLDMNPLGWTAVYRATARAVDPRALSKALPYLLLAVTLVAVGVAVWRLGGPGAAWSSAALCLSSEVFLTQMTGGLPRAFGFPATALAAAGLARGSPGLLAFAAILGAATYYPTGVLALALLGLLVMLPPGWTGLDESWTFNRRLRVAGVAGCLSIAVMAAGLALARPYGPTVGASDWLQYPEAGFGGRLSDEDVVARPSPSAFVEDIRRWTASTVVSSERPWLSGIADAGRSHQTGILILIAGVVGLGVWPLLRDQAAARRLALLPVAAATLYWLAWLIVPYFYVPARYLKFAIPISVCVFLPGALSAVGAFARRSADRWSSAAPVAFVTAVVLAVGSRGSTTAGLTVQLPPADAPFVRFVSDLPADSLIAGWPALIDEWPQRRATVNDVPYLSGRRVLVMEEAHLPFHASYLVELRRRTEALIGAYFATNVTPLIRLRDEFGVTHLLAERAHYGAEPPHYFHPFDAAVQTAAEHARGRSEVLRQSQWAAVFDDGQRLLLDLSRLR